ncbi:MAG: YncE family protein [Chitinophagia bacterium]|jgi:YVTN family beta-propeller protein
MKANFQTTFLILLIGICATSTMAQNKNFRVKQEFSIKSTGGWDYLSVNEDKLYVSHGSQVNILNKTTGDSISFIPNTTGIHGIAFDPIHKLGFTSNGRLNNVFAFDIHTNEVKATIATGENPDAIMYDPFSKTIITCNGRSKDLTFIDATTLQVIATVAVGGKPETAVSNEAGKIFVNVEDKNEIVVINAKTFLVEAHWSIAPIESPTGLAIDIATKRLFAGGEKLLGVINAETGKMVTTIAIGNGCDGVAFNNKTKLLFTSNGEGTMSIIKEEDANHFNLIENIPTLKSARTIALDESTNKIYLPAANFEPLPADAKPNTRAKMIPGSFKILVVNK